MLTYRNNFVLAVYLVFSLYGLSQNDFSITWNIYEPDMVVEDDPFNGGFTIKNEGENAISAYDTIWCGYHIEDTVYDLTLNEGLFTGIILTEDFLPGDEIPVYNWIYWPLWGSGLEITVCAVVYGVGHESYTGDFFTGDDNIWNNKSCLTAIVPPYTTNIENEAINDFEVFAIDGNIHIHSNNYDTNQLTIRLYSMQGKLTFEKVIESFNGNETIPLIDHNKGMYIIEFDQGLNSITKKLML